MSGEDNKLDFELNLDNSQFAQSVMGAISKVEGLGSAITEVAGVAGIFGAAFLAVKTAIDVTFEAEQINALTIQFENLTKQVGVSGEKMKEALMSASAGLLDDQEVIKIANKSLLEFGHNAERIPEVMELARKAALITGQGIAQTFEALSQAISTGQTRQLKQYGIIIDAEKAYRNYAASIGKTADELSEAGKKHAIMNAALEQGKEKLKEVDTGVNKTSDSWTRFKNSVKDVGDVVVLAMAKITAPVVNGTINAMSNAFGDLADVMKARFGTGADKTGAVIRDLEQKVKETSAAINQLQEIASNPIKSVMQASAAEELEKAKMQLDDYQERLRRLQSTVRQGAEGGKGGEGTTGGKSDSSGDVNREQELKKTAQFTQDIINIQKERLAGEIALNQDIKRVDDLVETEKVMSEIELQQKIAAITANTDIEGPRKLMIIQELRQAEVNKIQQFELKKQQMQEETLNLYLKKSHSTAEGVERGFIVGTKKAELAQLDFGAVGARVFKSFEGNAVSALQAVGAGQKDAGEAAKGFLFGMLADEAQARGTLMLLSSVWPPNPVGIAGGAALIALSGLLRSQAGGGGGGAATPAASASAGLPSPGTGGTSVMDPSRPDIAQAAVAHKSVNITVMGSMYNSEETRRAIVEAVRAESDATDFIVRNN